MGSFPNLSVDWLWLHVFTSMIRNLRWSSFVPVTECLANDSRRLDPSSLGFLASGASCDEVECHGGTVRWRKGVHLMASGDRDRKGIGQIMFLQGMPSVVTFFFQ